MQKQLAVLDEHSIAFIKASPMVILATADADGRVDASPRGDPPGFVQPLSDANLVIPDRKGNRRVDSMMNILSNPNVGLLFLVPGREETLRVNGSAHLTDDADVLSRCAVNSSTPPLGIIVDVEEVFFHCARAFRRSQLWEPGTWSGNEDLASLGFVLRDQVNDDSASSEQWDSWLEKANQDLY